MEKVILGTFPSQANVEALVRDLSVEYRILAQDISIV